MKYTVKHEGAYSYMFQDGKEIGATEAVKLLNEAEGKVRAAIFVMCNDFPYWMGLKANTQNEIKLMITQRIEKRAKEGK